MHDLRMLGTNVLVKTHLDLWERGQFCTLERMLISLACHLARTAEPPPALHGPMGAIKAALHDPMGAIKVTPPPPDAVLRRRERWGGPKITMPGKITIKDPHGDAYSPTPTEAVVMPEL